MSRASLMLALWFAIPVSAFAAPPVQIGQITSGFDRVTQIAQHPDGRVYVADAYRHRIQVFDPQGFYLEDFGSQGSALGQFNVASGIGFDSQGAVYVAEQAGHRITKLSPSHLPLMTFGSAGAGPGQLSAPTCLAVSSDDRIFVTEFLNDRVSVFDTNGGFITSFGGHGAAPGQFDHPFGIGISPANELYVADELNNRIQVFDLSGNFLRQFGTLGTGPGQFHFCGSLAFDPGGDVYVTDQLNNRVQRVTSTGVPVYSWGSLGSGNDQFYNPWCIARLASGRIWVGDAYNYRVSIYAASASAPAQASGEAPGLEPAMAAAPPAPGVTPSANAASSSCGTLVPAFDRHIGGAAGRSFDQISQIVRRGDGRIYLADAYRHRIVVLNEAGMYLEQIGRAGALLGQFNLPAGIAFDDDDQMFVAEQLNHRITRFSPANLPMAAIGSPGSGPGQLDVPTNLAYRDGRLYVTELLNQRVSIFSPSGVFQSSFGSQGTAPGQFRTPFGIVIDDTDGEVFVADGLNHRVQVFNPSGVPLRAFGVNGTGLGQFDQPVGLGLDASGRLFVTDQLNNRVQIFQQDGTPVLAWGTFGTDSGQFYNPWAVLPLASGEIWVADTYNHRVSVYGPEYYSVQGSFEIYSITDVPFDEGKRVRIRFQAAPQDRAGSPTPVLQYEAYRHIDEPLAAAVARPPAGPRSAEGTTLAGWEFAGAIPAHAESEYNMIVPTIVNGWPSTFFIRAATGQPAIYFDTCPDTGAALDNTAPPAPDGFVTTVDTGNGDVVLGWNASGAPDLDHYRLHRGPAPGFLPDASNRLATTTAPGYVDAGAAAGGGPLYYKVASVDSAGNTSDFVEQGVDLTLHAVDEAPQRFALHAAQPNPTAAGTVIGFDLPVAAPVTLKIFDAQGRLVRELAGGADMPVGRHRMEWDGRSVSGARVPAGIYFVRFRAASYEAHRTVIALP